MTVDASINPHDSIAPTPITMVGLDAIPNKAMHIIDCVDLQYSTIPSDDINTSVSSQSTSAAFEIAISFFSNG